MISTVNISQHSESVLVVRGNIGLLVILIAVPTISSEFFVLKPDRGIYFNAMYNTFSLIYLNIKIKPITLL